jgi:5-formyltetrahydrofolate cyclo-ligase
MKMNNLHVKKHIRRTYLDQRKALGQDHVIASSQLISHRILSSESYRLAKTIFCYYPSNKECNILDVAQDALNKGKIVAFPKSYNQRYMDFLQIHSITSFEKGRFDIMEPISNQVVEPDQDTLVLVPGIAFDEKNYRIGYGGGYYDSYFDRFSKSGLKKIGVYYQWQKTPMIPVELHDIPLDHIIHDG